MPYRELTMIDIKEVLRRWSARQSLHRIARETGVDRKTVRRYVHAAQSCSLPQGRELTEDEIHEVAQRVQSRPVVDASAEWQSVAVHQKRIEEWLTSKRPLRLTKVHTLLRREHGLEVSYDTLRRFAMQQIGWRQRASTVRIDDPPPGQEAQIDFGKMGPMSMTDAQHAPSGAKRTYVPLARSHQDVGVQTWFREDFFGEYPWAHSHGREERVPVEIEVILDNGNVHLGPQTFELSHDPTRARNNDEPATRLHLNAAILDLFLRNESYVKGLVTLIRRADGGIELHLAQRDGDEAAPIGRPRGRTSKH